MKGHVRSTSVAALAGAAMAIALLATTVDAQKAADVAAKFTGTWVLNRELSPALGGARKGGATRLYEIGFFSAFQGRGGGGRGGGGDTPEAGGADAADQAGQKAIASLQQFGATITITASADSITFKDTRGERTYPVNDKTVKIDVGDGASVGTRSKWDKSALKQQFNFGETQMSQVWEVNDAGSRINVKMTILNMSRTEIIPVEAKVVYDKQ